MTLRVAFDAATPPSTVPAGATTACIYMGGDTPNPIADPRTVPVYAQVTYWLPGWVRSNPTPTKATADGQGAVAWLLRNGAPQGIATFLDLETAVTPAYVDAYGAVLHAAGFRVLPYTSRVNMGKNPPLDGYFVADPTDPPKTLYQGSVATQYAYMGAYDLSVITASVPLWLRPAPAPTPAPAPVQAPSTPSVAGNGLILRTRTHGAAYLCVGTKLVGLTAESQVQALQAAGVGVAELAAADFAHLVAGIG